MSRQLLLLLPVLWGALIHRPHIHISGSLESGRPRNLTCSVPWACEQGTPPIFSWTSAALISLGPRTLLSSVLTLTPRPQDNGTNLTCQVKFPAAGVTVEMTIQLNVTFLWPGEGLVQEPRARVFLGAVGGAGIMALLSLCLFLIFRVKTCRKKAGQPVQRADDMNPVKGSGSGVSEGR
uniref:Ig-like domain-containing protein n=1 Tax=Equus asinus asinus TaxID=83772 RepID=A0A8C4LI79_EQUAS